MSELMDEPEGFEDSSEDGELEEKGYGEEEDEREEPLPE
jgi:hypothetical protein